MVDGHDVTTPLLAQSGCEAVDGGHLHREPRFEERPEAGGVGPVAKDEDPRAEVEQGDVAQGTPEDELLGRGTLLLWRARKVDPHEFDGRLAAHVRTHGRELDALRVRVPLLLPAVRDGKQIVRILVRTRALQSDFDLDKPVWLLPPQVLEPGQHPIITVPKLVGLDAPENNTLVLVGGGLRLRCDLFRRLGNMDCFRARGRHTGGRERQRHLGGRNRAPAPRLDPLDGVALEHTDAPCDLQKLLLGKPVQGVQIVVPNLVERRSVPLQSENGQAGGDLVLLLWARHVGLREQLALQWRRRRRWGTAHTSAVPRGQNLGSPPLSRLVGHAGCGVRLDLKVASSTHEDNQKCKKGLPRFSNWQQVCRPNK